jgi:hypothetical protein
METSYNINIYVYIYNSTTYCYSSDTTETYQRHTRIQDDNYFAGSRATAMEKKRSCSRSLQSRARSKSINVSLSSGEVKQQFRRGQCIYRLCCYINRPTLIGKKRWVLLFFFRCNNFCYNRRTVWVMVMWGVWMCDDDSIIKCDVRSLYRHVLQRNFGIIFITIFGV